MLTAGVEPVTSAEAPLWVPVNAIGALGSALVLIGFPAIAPRLTELGGRAGHSGLSLVTLSWVFFGPFLSLCGALVQPWLADEAPRLVDGSSTMPAAFTVAFAIGLLAWLAGGALLAIPFMPGRSKPRWIGYQASSEAQSR